jgi:hypothetical protein
MAKEPKPPSVKDQLERVELLLRREEERLKAESDPLALNPQRDEKLVQEGEEGDLRQALSHVEVRRVFFRLLKNGGLMEADSDPNPTIMSHHVGRRSMAVEIYNMLRAVDPGVYYQMEREAASDAKSRKEREKQNAD